MPPNPGASSFLSSGLSTTTASVNRIVPATDAAFSKVEAKLDADKSVKGLRESVQEGIEIDVRAKSGVSGLLDAIKGLVTTISTATTSINGKLPIAVVGA